MFGKNEITKTFTRRDGLLVNSIWPTIQGEGPDVGRVSIFIRLSKCNLACTFCDTEFETGTWATHKEVLTEVVKQAEQCRAQLVVITGGEPLLQNVAPLIKDLNKQGLAVAIETAGTVYHESLDSLFHGGSKRWMGNIIVCSPKTPKIDIRLSLLIGAYKYIIRAGETSADDGLPIFSTQRNGYPSQIYRGTGTIYVQAMDEQDPIKNDANLKLTTEICMKFGYRLSYQLHKLIGVA